ncbi:MAG: hypothetical protein H6934_12980, partial [Burkholderiaceae bacterium]|nr:hypothetical protein [Burkholderiaceae bacterium]
MNKMIRLLALAPAVFMGACGIPSGEVSDADTLKVMKASFVESGQVKLDRLE